MSVCSHINKLKPEKIANIANNVKRSDLCQSSLHSNKTLPLKQSSDIWVCLDCGNQACSKYSESSCAQKHYVEQKHRLAIGVKKLLVYCFECDNDLQSILDELDLDGVSNNNTKKLEIFIDKVRQSFYKLQQAQTKGSLTASSQTTSNPQQTNIINASQYNTSIPQQPKILEKIPNFIFGLQNLGNTCFFNSVIQCLNGTPDIIQQYLESAECDFDQQIDLWEEIDQEEKQMRITKEEKQDEDDGWCSIKKKESKQIVMSNIDSDKYTKIPAKKINQLFKRLLQEGRLAKAHIHNPTSMYKAVSQLFVRFKTFEQQDAHDLLRCLLDSLIVGEVKWLNLKKNIDKKAGKHKNTITENIFGSYIANYYLAVPIASKNNISSQAKKQLVPLDIHGIQEEKKQDVTQESKTQSNSVQEKQESSSESDLKSSYQKIDNKELIGCKIPYFSQTTTQFMWEPVEYTSKVQESNNQTRKLENLLDEFCSFEILNKSNNYYKCEKCGQSQKSLRKFYLYEPPQVLTLVLKRFVQTGNSRFEKINYHVDFPEKINLDPYTLVKSNNSNFLDEDYNKNFRKNFNYEIYAVLCHQGSLNQGHYVSYVKHIINGVHRWFYYSDEEYYETNWQNVKATQAYILFYKKI